MDKLQGHPLDIARATSAQKCHFFEQFADIFVELSSHPFPGINCLEVAQSGDTVVGPLVEAHTAQVLDGCLSQLGPFSTTLAYRTVTIERHLSLIQNNEVYTERRVDAYLVHRYLLDNVDALASLDTRAGGGFYLKHMDDKGDQILVDDEFNIVGVIDWEWAQTVPKSDAFAAPLFLLDMGAYYSGDNAPSDMEQTFVRVLEEKGHADLASCVTGGRPEHRIAHCVGGDMGDQDFANMFSALRGYLVADGGVVPEWNEWRREMLERLRDDATLRMLLEGR